MRKHREITDSSIRRWQSSNYIFEISDILNFIFINYITHLRWVKDHISNFGGNPNSITIFGESAGGASVEFQILSPHSKGKIRVYFKLMNELFIHLLLLFFDKYKGLFHRAIAQSGSASCPWALQKSVGEYTRILAEDLNCPTSNSRELLDCMRKTEAEKIMDSMKKLMIPIV